MTPTLAVETSSPHFGIAVADGPTVLAHRTQRRDLPGFPGIAAFVAEVLAASGLAFADLGRVAVNVGPGNLGSVRAGVAYANGLAFSRGVPVASADSLGLLAAEVARRDAGTGPVLCLRHAGAGNVFAALDSAGVPPVLRFGPVGEVVPELAAGLPAVVVAGVMRDGVAALLPGTRVSDSGVEVPSVLTLVAAVAGCTAVDRAVATPLTESSAIFLAGNRQ